VKEVKLLDSDESHGVYLKVPSTVSADVDFVLPGTAGSNGDVLTTNGSGTLSWAAPSASVGNDSLDFDKFADAMALDASTSITADGSEVLSIVNTGTGDSFLVQDVASDTTPFVIDASGNVGIGTASPESKVTVAGLTNGDGFLMKGSTANQNFRIYNTDSGGNLYWVFQPGTAATGPTIIYNPSSASTSGLAIRNNGGSYNWVHLYHNDTRGVIETTNSTPLVLQPSGGNLGIGTATPNGLLHVHRNSTSDSYARFTNTASGVTGGDGLEVGYASDAGYLWNYEYTPIVFGVNDDEAMRISEDGDLGLWNDLYQINGDSGDGFIMHSRRDNGYDFWQMAPVTGWSTDWGKGIALVRSTGYVGIGTSSPSHILHITAQGRSTSSSWATSSDRRVKTNIQPLAGGLDTILRLNPVTFEYIPEYRIGKSGLDGKQRGFIAQEVEAVMPEMVKVIDEKFGDKEIRDFRLLTNSDFVPLLVKAVKELKAFVDGLAAKVETLIAQVTGHDAAIKELKAANDNLRKDLKAANDNHTAEIQELKKELVGLRAAIKKKE
jgi:hypothetical protein